MLFLYGSVEGIDLAEFECVYSPAKRRGPVPGKQGTTRKHSDLGMSGHDDEDTSNAEWPQQQWNDPNLIANAQNASSVSAALQQQLGLLQQLQRQNHHSIPIDDEEIEEPAARRLKRQEEPHTNQVPQTITSHTHLLERNDPEGSRLFAYYKLSVDEMFRLPPTPGDEEFCARVPGMTPTMIPGPQLAALSAARFAEIALGALVHNEVSLAMELCNAVVHCLRESASEPIQPQVMFEVAKAYFLLGVFRAFRGDMQRYFKYRRVCLTYLSKIDVRITGFGGAFCGSVKHIPKLM